MPSVQDNITRLAGSSIFSAVDMEGAFHCIPLDPRDKAKTSFATPFGPFQNKCLGFGLTNGPSAYCRLVERVLQDIPPSVAIGFLDDGVIHSSTFQQHIKNLFTTLEAYRAAGMKLSPFKCSFVAAEIDYLGHRLNADGIRPTDDYLKAVRKWKLPSTKTEARAFLGVVNYYRNHIPDYATLSKSWTDVTGKGSTKALEKAKLVVTPAMIAAFHTLINRLTSAPVLGFPYFKGPKAGQFILDTDFSRFQTAGILSQMQLGKEVVIAYGSKKLSKSQLNWPSTKGELHAGMFWMGKYEYYLKYGPKFLWRTDNLALKYVKSMTSLIRLPTTLPLLSHDKTELKSLQKEDADLSVVRSFVKEPTTLNRLSRLSLSRVARSYADMLDHLSFDSGNVLVFQLPDSSEGPSIKVPCSMERHDRYRSHNGRSHVGSGHC